MKLLRVLVLLAPWLSLAINVSVWAALRRADEWAGMVPVAYGPRWVWAVPPLLALWPAARRSRRDAIVAAGALVVAVVTIMPLEVPGRRESGHADRTVVLTLNAGYRADPEAVSALVGQVGADIVVLQEWRQATERFRDGYTMSCAGGLCIAARHQLEPAGELHRAQLGGYHYMASRVRVRTPGGTLSVGAVHLETVRKGLEALMQRPSAGLDALRANIRVRDLESRRVARWLEEEPLPLIIAGDFNLTADSAIYRRYWSRWTNAFGAAGWGYGHTKFTRWWGVRIDHVLVDSRSFEVMDAWTGPAVGSDHRPVVAVLRRR